MQTIQLPLQTMRVESTLAPSQIQSKTDNTFKETIIFFCFYYTYNNFLFHPMPLLV